MYWQDKKYWTIFALAVLILTLLLIYDTSEYSVSETDSLTSPTHQESKITSIIAVGDIMLSRNVGSKIDKTDNPNLPFEKLINLLSSPDITFGNLECPLDDSGAAVREGLVFRCLTEYVPGLAFAGFDILSTANNHSFDQGEDNLRFTTEYLLENGILPVGTGDFQTGQIIEKNDTKFGFLAYSYTAKNDGGQSAHPLIATWDDREQAERDIENLKQKSDLVIVSIHAGTEYASQPTEAQVNFAHLAIDSGADIVIGHHPHWIQTIEIYNNKPIFYSLGNFVFDQMWSEQTREGLMVKFQITNSKLQTAELIPIIIDDFCCPRLADEDEKNMILN